MIRLVIQEYVVQSKRQEHEKDTDRQPPGMSLQPSSHFINSHSGQNDPTEEGDEYIAVRGEDN
jgi:hypothetical protein